MCETIVGNRSVSLTFFCNVSISSARRGVARQRKLGTPIESLDDYRKAIETYTEIIKRDSGNLWAYMSRADCLCNRGLSDDFNQAIADYTRVIRLDPDNFSAYFGRGVCHKSLGGESNLQSAVDDLTQAIQLNPKHAESYLFRGEALTFLYGYGFDKRWDEHDEEQLRDYEMYVSLTESPNWQIAKRIKELKSLKAYEGKNWWQKLWGQT